MVAGDGCLREGKFPWLLVMKTSFFALLCLAILVSCAPAGWHPAQKMSMIHHRDIATAMLLALRGAMDGHVVNIVDEAPTSIYELAGLVGETMKTSSDPLENPWHLHTDGSLARSLGFQPVVRTVYQAAQKGLL